MGINRRTLLLGLAGASLARPGFAADNAHAKPAALKPAFVAARKDAEGFAAVLLASDGSVISRAALPRRGHGAAISTTSRWAVIFARRPGALAIPFSLASGRPDAPFTPPPNRRFSGHGCFSPDGKLLFTAENNFEASQGLIGIYDAINAWRRLGEFATRGIGPHEVLMLRDGRTLAVANGGIATHPELPRMKLNLATMAPSLAYIDSQTGALLERATLPPARHHLSIRHLVETAQGDIWWGGQYEGAAADLPPLIGVHRRGQPMALLAESATPALRNYVGSIAVNRAGNRVAITSPRGGTLQIWDAVQRRLIRSHALMDISGVAAMGSSFIASDGLGHLHDMAATGHSMAGRAAAIVRKAPGVAWDNHIAAITG